MYDPDQPPSGRPGAPGEQPEETWDQWFGRHYGRGGASRRLMIYAVAVVITMIGLYVSGNSAWFHR